MSLSFVATFYTSYQQCVFIAVLVVFLVPFAVYSGWSDLSRQLRPAVKGLAMFLVISLLLMSPLLFELAAHYGEAVVRFPTTVAGSMSLQPDRLVYNQTFRHWWNDCIQWGPAHHLFQSLDPLIPGRGPMYGYLVASILVVGWILLPLRKENRASIVYWSFSIIPVIWIMMGTQPTLFGFGLPSVVPLLMKLPGFSAVRALYRYSIPLTLMVSILVGFILKTSRENKHDQMAEPAHFSTIRFRSARRLIFISLLILLPYLEYLKIPLQVNNLPAPPAIYLEGGLSGSLGGAADERSAILELPYWCSGGDFWIGANRYETLYFQTLHNRKLVGGHHSRMCKEAVPQSVFNKPLHYLSEVDFGGMEAPPPVHARKAFRNLGIRYVNASRASYRPEDEDALVSYLVDVLDAELLYEDEWYLTYRIPRHSKPAD